jgi:hypothetical protein
VACEPIHSYGAINKVHPECRGHYRCGSLDTGAVSANRSFIDDPGRPSMNRLKSQTGALLLILAIVGAVAIVLYVAHRL